MGNGSSALKNQKKKSMTLTDEDVANGTEYVVSDFPPVLPAEDEALPDALPGALPANALPANPGANPGALPNAAADDPDYAAAEDVRRIAAREARDAEREEREAERKEGGEGGDTDDQAKVVSLSGDSVEELTVTVIPDKARVLYGVRNTVKCLVQIKTPALPADQQRPQMQVSVVMDKSGSMQIEKKLTFAKHGVRKLIKHLEETDRLHFVTYDTNVRKKR